MNTEAQQHAPLNAEQLNKYIETFSKQAQVNAGLPNDFLDRIIGGEDDWSFVVKGHALLEAAFNEFLVQALGRPSLSECIGRMQLGGRTGKLEMAKAIGGLPPEMVKFAEKFKDIRNRVVHHVTDTSFSFKEYFNGLTMGDRKDLLQAACLEGFVTVELEAGESDVDVDLKDLFTHALKAVLCFLHMASFNYYLARSATRIALMCEPAGQDSRPIFELARNGPGDNDSNDMPKWP